MGGWFGGAVMDMGYEIWRFLMSLDGASVVELKKGVKDKRSVQRSGREL